LIPVQGAIALHSIAMLSSSLITQKYSCIKLKK
jgi:hypothetical protein